MRTKQQKPPQQNVMVFVELDEGVIAEVSLELVSAATRLAAALGAEVEAVALGHGAGPALARLGHYGCRRVYYLDDPRLARYTPVPFAKSICAVVRRAQPRIVLYGATANGRSVAPRVASELGCGLTADCTDLEIGDVELKGEVFPRQLLQIRPAFGGNIVATIVSPRSVPSQATVRPGVMKLAVPDPAGVCEIVSVPLPVADGDFLSEVLEQIRRERTVNLSAAQIIVTAGMGAGTPEGVELCRQLAKAIGGALGASRPVVDAGLLPKDHQVGQTGTTVRPNLYIACGVSGSIQHLAGMKESQRILAINSDPTAPILRLAHYGIVGDLREVVPRLIAAYKQAH
jgi:electron transfer flavoprotein alpha subunit